MTPEKYYSLYDKVYNLTSDVTPRKFDCGKLCGSACCKNLSCSKQDSGMYLLPFEKEYLKHMGADTFSYIDTGDGYILNCNGTCNRSLRPFACRIFPYYVSFENDKLKLKKDLRAAYVCPLLYKKESKRADIRFIRNIKRAVRLLVQDEDIKNDFLKTSEFIENLYELYSKLN